MYGVIEVSPSRRMFVSINRTSQKYSCCTIEILLICNDDQKDFLMALFWSAFGIPDDMDICVQWEQVLPSRSYPYHQSHNEIEKVFFEEQKWPSAYQKPYNAQWNQKVLSSKPTNFDTTIGSLFVWTKWTFFFWLNGCIDRCVMLMGVDWWELALDKAHTAT